MLKLKRLAGRNKGRSICFEPGSLPSMSQVWATWAGAGMWLQGVMTAPRLSCLSPNMHQCICCAFLKNLAFSCFLFPLANYWNNWSKKLKSLFWTEAQKVSERRGLLWRRAERVGITHPAEILQDFPIPEKSLQENWEGIFRIGKGLNSPLRP